MTITHKYEEFTSESGLKMFIEQYSEKTNFVKFWRYGVNGIIWKDCLLSKPNKKKLIENY